MYERIRSLGHVRGAYVETLNFERVTEVLVLQCERMQFESNHEVPV